MAYQETLILNTSGYLDNRITVLSGYNATIPIVTGFAITGGSNLTGLLSINAGSNITLTQIGNNTVSIASTASGPGGGNVGITGISITGSNYFSGNGQINISGSGGVSVVWNGLNNVIISGVDAGVGGGYPSNNPAQFSTSGNLYNSGNILYDNIIGLSGTTNRLATGIVYITGNQTINGTKTFLNNIVAPAIGQDSQVDIFNYILNDNQPLPALNWENKTLITQDGVSLNWNNKILSGNWRALGSVGINTNNTMFALNIHGTVGIEDNGDNTLISGSGNNNSFVEINVQNFNSGENASSDLVATSDIGNENNYYINVGINSSRYTGSSVGFTGDTYLLSKANDLYIGNVVPNRMVNLFAGASPTGGNSGEVTLYRDRVSINASLQISGNTVLTHHSGVSITGITSLGNANTYAELMSGLYEPGGWLFLANVCAHAPTQISKFTLNTRLWDGVSQTYFISQENTMLTGLGGIGIINMPIIQFVQLTGAINRVNLSCASDIANVRIRNLPSGNLPVGTTSGTTSYMRGIRLY